MKMINQRWLRVRVHHQHPQQHLHWITTWQKRIWMKINKISSFFFYFIFTSSVHLVVKQRKNIWTILSLSKKFNRYKIISAKEKRITRIISFLFSFVRSSVRLMTTTMKNLSNHLSLINHLHLASDCVWSVFYFVSFRTSMKDSHQREFRLEKKRFLLWLWEENVCFHFDLVVFEGKRNRLNWTCHYTDLDIWLNFKGKIIIMDDNDDFRGKKKKNKT